MALFSGKKNTKSLLKILAGADVQKRNQAARELLEMGADAAGDLVLALGSKDANLRGLSAQLLARIGRDALPALNGALPKAPKALGAQGNPECLPNLLISLSDADPDVRIEALKALGKFRAPQTYPNLCDLLNDPEINVRIAAAQTLQEIGDPTTIPYLMDELYDSFWWYGREEAIQTLLNAIASFGKTALNELLDAMKANEPTVRRYAISLLRPLKEESAIDALEMAFYDTNYDVAEMALRALIEFGAGVLPILADALVSPNLWIREKAVWALGEIGGEQAVLYLLEMLNDSADSVRVESIASLTKLRDPRALPTLRAIAQNRDEREIAKLARQAIAEMES